MTRVLFNGEIKDYEDGRGEKMKQADKENIRNGFPRFRGFHQTIVAVIRRKLCLTDITMEDEVEDEPHRIDNRIECPVIANLNKKEGHGKENPWQSEGIRENAPPHLFPRIIR